MERQSVTQEQGHGCPNFTAVHGEWKLARLVWVEQLQIAENGNEMKVLGRGKSWG